ncbi:hypothetical protein [Dyella sp. 2RAB6]|uniref:hypothetical protein n=1 Tax=Dyella sp. 2RAB6 TaxID=3232992 RepID=UPI003F8FED87
MSKGAMRRFALVFLVAVLAGVPVSKARAQSETGIGADKPCDRVCQQAKVQALFDQAEKEAIADRPKPSLSSECLVFDGHDHIDPLIDVCAKLKYVRSLPAGVRTRFSCPSDTRSLIGLTLDRIRSIWGEPDFIDEGKSQIGSRPGPYWMYFIGSPVPLAFGGGFPELSLYYDDAGIVKDITCFYSR